MSTMDFLFCLSDAAKLTGSADGVYRSRRVYLLQGIIIHVCGDLSISGSSRNLIDVLLLLQLFLYVPL